MVPFSMLVKLLALKGVWYVQRFQNLILLNHVFAKITLSQS